MVAVLVHVGSSLQAGEPIVLRTSHAGMLHSLTGIMLQVTHYYPQRGTRIRITTNIFTMPRVQVKSVRIWQKPGGEHYKKDDCDCAAGRQEVTDTGGTGSQDDEPSSSGKGASVDASMQPPADAEGTFRFMMMLTVFNTLMLLAAMASWGSSAFRRQCASWGGARKKRQREAGYRLAESTMPGSEEVEMR